MLIQRQIAVSITLAANTQTNQPNTFAETQTDTLQIQGLRTSVRIFNSGNPTGCRAEVKIWGLPPSIMNQLSTLGMVVSFIPRNTIQIMAGNAGGQLSVVYQGTITQAYAEYESQPDVPLVLVSNFLAFERAAMVQPTSYPNPFDVATAMKSFAAQINYAFQNNGIQMTMPPHYFSGSVQDQIDQLGRMARIGVGYPDFKTLQIWPLLGNRTTPNVPKISPLLPDGSISYPSFTQQGVIQKTVFNPLISFGGLVEIDSTVLSALAQVQQQRGLTFPTQWSVIKLDLALDADLPNGQWMSIVYGYSPQVAQQIIPPS
jgi:hypothetical protein